MKCPFCRASSSEIFNTRSTRFASQVWRRRRCMACQQAFTTYEAPDLSHLKVHHPDQRKPVAYSRAKLFSSVYAAFHDVPQKDSDVDAVTATIEAKILDLQSSAVKRSEIARIISVTLQHYNTGAFLRYLSFHTELNSSAQLKRELKKYHG